MELLNLEDSEKMGATVIDTHVLYGGAHVWCDDKQLVTRSQLQLTIVTGLDRTTSEYPHVFLRLTGNLDGSIPGSRLRMPSCFFNIVVVTPVDHARTVIADVQRLQKVLHTHRSFNLFLTRICVQGIPVVVRVYFFLNSGVVAQAVERKKQTRLPLA